MHILNLVRTKFELRVLCVGVPTSLCNTNRAETGRLEPFLGLLGPWGVTLTSEVSLWFVVGLSCGVGATRDGDGPMRPATREAAHRPRSNGALLNQAHSRCLPPTRRRSHHRLRRRRPRGPLRIQLTAGDPDAAARVSSDFDLVTSQTALFARAPARTEPGRGGRRTQAEANARTAATCVKRTFQSDSPPKSPSSDCISCTTKLRVEANHHLIHRPP